VNVLDPVMTLPSGVIQTLIVPMTRHIIVDGAIPQHIIGLGGVLIMINLDATKQLVNEQMLDVMEVTMCEHLHDLRPPEDLALFTYSCLLAPGQLQIVSVGDLLTYISQYIFNTWGIHIESTAMDLRWSDCTGDTFALRPNQIITRLLREHRPHWTEAQEIGISNSLVDFTNPGQPYIMQLSCHKALPNPNYLP